MIWTFETMWQIREGGSSAQWIPVWICATRRVERVLALVEPVDVEALARELPLAVRRAGTLRRIGIQ